MFHREVADDLRFPDGPEEPDGDQADELLDNIVSYIGRRFGLIERDPPRYDTSERDREDRLRAAITTAFRNGRSG